MNAYGPTECTVCATACDCREAVPPVIGRPFAHIDAYVVDTGSGERITADSVEGELCLAGDCVARGYYRDPVATAARFVPCPWGPYVHTLPWGALCRGECVRSLLMNQGGVWVKQGGTAHVSHGRSRDVATRSPGVSGPP